MYELPKLDYEYTDLEPHFDAKTMQIHHSKHHAGYTKKFNAALEGNPELLDKDPFTLLQNLDSVPESIRQAVRNNGGGFVNHKMFWTMFKKGGSEPGGEIEEAIKKRYGSYVDFKEQFSKSAATLFGSGWTWLMVNNGQLQIVNSQNQDVPSGKPVMLLDIWEHAYYLKFQNRRPDYIEAFWHILNWDKINEYYLEAMK